MAITALKIKAFPEEPKADLEKLKQEIILSLEKENAKSIKIEEEPIAFGLKALIITIAWPEENSTEKAEDACKIPGISSVEIIDYRRAFG